MENSVNRSEANIGFFKNLFPFDSWIIDYYLINKVIICNTSCDLWLFIVCLAIYLAIFAIYLAIFAIYLAIYLANRIRGRSWEHCYAKFSDTINVKLRWRIPIVAQL